MTHEDTKKLIRSLERIGGELAKLNKTLSACGWGQSAPYVAADGNWHTDGSVDAVTAGSVETHTTYGDRIFAL